MKILQATPTPLLKLIERYGLMPAVEDVVVNVGGIERFEAHYLPILEQLSDRIQEIPLQKAAFADLGGALVCAVRAGTLAVRTCDATIFSPTATAAERLANDAHYRWLAWCAVMANIYLIACASIDIVHASADGRQERYSWADDRHLVEWRPNYQMAWVERPQLLLGRLSPFLGPFFFPGQFAHLPRTLISDLGAALNPGLVSISTEPALARVVRQSIERVIADEKSTTSAWVLQLSSCVASSTAPVGGEGPSARADQSSDAARPRLEDAPPVSAGHAGLVDPQTGEILAEGIDPALGVQAAAPAAKEDSPALIKAREWLVGLAAAREMDHELTLMPDKKLVINRKCVGFGGKAAVVFKMLQDAGLVHIKKMDEAILIPEAGAIYEQAKKSFGG